MNNLIKHAKREFIALDYKPVEELKNNDPNRWIQENVFELLNTRCRKWTFSE